MLEHNQIRPWDLSERDAFRPPEDITVSEWAAKYRVLPKTSAIPGLWNNRLGPYAVGVMDAFNAPWVERITIMAAVQSMKTESVYNMLGFAVCQDPAPALVVMPTLNTMKRVNRRIRKMFLSCPELAQHLTGNPDDVQLHQIILDRMEIYFATAGSDADLQNIEARYIIDDETDEYSQDGEGGDAVEKTIDRSTTYWNRKVIELSRPTNPDGHIYKSYEKSDRRKYWVPCPHCGGYQVLSFWQVKHRGEKLGAWPKELQDPEYIKRERAACYECRHCAGEIDDRHKAEMMARGKWVPMVLNEGGEEGPAIRIDLLTGELLDPIPPAEHVGFWWNALYSPFRSFSEVAAQFFKVKNDREKYRTFVNQWLAEPWKEVIQQRPASAILQLRTHRPALEVPENTLALTVGIDSQKRGFWSVIRAWVLTNDGLRESHKIRHGFLGSFGEVEQWVFDDVYRTAGGQEYRIWSGFIDTGGGLMGEGEATLTEQVYNWLRRSSRGRIFGSKGSSRPLAGGRLVKPSQIDYYPSGKRIPGGLMLWHLDTNALKDFIWARIENGLFHLDGGPDLSFDADKIPEDDRIYAAHLAAEVKERNKQGRMVWTVQYQQANHLLDCEVLAAAAAEAFNVWLLPRPEAPQAQEVEVAAGHDNHWVGRGSGWFRR